MRAWDVRSEVLFGYVNCEQRVPKDHPLRAILRIVDEALGALTLEFEGLYAKLVGRRSRRSDCFGPCCCRPSIRSARSGS